MESLTSKALIDGLLPFIVPLVVAIVAIVWSLVIARSKAKKTAIILKAETELSEAIGHFADWRQNGSQSPRTKATQQMLRRLIFARIQLSKLRPGVHCYYNYNPETHPFEDLDLVLKQR